MASKNCPYCAETIQAQAIKCRFCNERVNLPYAPFRLPKEAGGALEGLCPICRKERTFLQPEATVPDSMGRIAVHLLFFKYILLSILTMLLVRRRLGALATRCACPTCLSRFDVCTGCAFPNPTAERTTCCQECGRLLSRTWRRPYSRFLPAADSGSATESRKQAAAG